jgi:UDP-2,3-diacylglucosamine hydrolase
VPVYLASDVHLRLDYPERGRRLARWVDTLGADDSLILAGDLCDFWYATRERRADPMACAGLRSLAAFSARGGDLTVMPGNHDAWLGPFYEATLGARFVREPLELEASGRRLHVIHGHLLGVRRPWKVVMETRAFFEGFGRVPSFLARRLDVLLSKDNERTRERMDRRHLALYRRYADRLAGSVDLVVFGHVHAWKNDDTRRPRLVVLGGWHRRSSYLKVDPSGAWLVVEPEMTSTRLPGG